MRRADAGVLSRKKKVTGAKKTNLGLFVNHFPVDLLSLQALT
jgi:hypothetical protein